MKNVEIKNLTKYLFFFSPVLGTIGCGEEFGRNLILHEEIKGVQKFTLSPEILEKLNYLERKNCSQLKNYGIILGGKLLSSFLLSFYFPLYFLSESLALTVGICSGIECELSEEEQKLAILEYFKD